MKERAERLRQVELIKTNMENKQRKFLRSRILIWQARNKTMMEKALIKLHVHSVSMMTSEKFKLMEQQQEMIKLENDKLMRELD